MTISRPKALIASLSAAAAVAGFGAEAATATRIRLVMRF